MDNMFYHAKHSIKTLGFGTFRVSPTWHVCSVEHPRSSKISARGAVNCRAPVLESLMACSAIPGVPVAQQQLHSRLD